jgi:hypothetical protein
MIDVQPGLKSIIRGSLWNFRQTGQRKFLVNAFLFTAPFVRTKHHSAKNETLDDFFSVSKRLEMMEAEMRQRIWRTNEEKKEFLRERRIWEVELSRMMPEAMCLCEPVWEEMKILEKELTEDEFKFGLFK